MTSLYCTQVINAFFSGGGGRGETDLEKPIAGCGFSHDAMLDKITFKSAKPGNLKIIVHLG